MKSLHVFTKKRQCSRCICTQFFFLLFVYINVAKTQSSVRPSEIKCHIKMEEDIFAQWKSIFQLRRSTKRVISEHTVTPVLQRLKWNTLFISDGVIMGNPFISLQSPWAGVFYETITLFSLLTAGEWGCLKAILQEDLSSYAGAVDAQLYLHFLAHYDTNAIIKHYSHKLRWLKMLILCPLGQLFLVSGLGIKNGS